MSIIKKLEALIERNFKDACGSSEEVVSINDLRAIIEEYKATGQAPFGWAWAIIHEKTGTIVNYGFSLQKISTQTETSVGLAYKVIPLFTHPQLSDENVSSN